MKIVIISIFLLLFISVVANADFKVATGTITTPTSTGNAAVTGVGFQPKVIILHTTSSNSLTQGIIQGFGVCQSSSARWTSYVAELQTGSTANQYGRGFKATECITALQNNGANVTYLEGDLVTMDSDGFTINWTTVQASGQPVYYLALGGTDLNVKVGTFDSGSGTGSQAITGVGFLPKTVFIANTISNTTEGTTTAVVMTLGYGQSSSQRFFSNFFGNFNTPTYESRSKQTTSDILSRLTNASVVNGEADLTSLDSDGFTLNFTTNTAARRYGYLALNGINVASGVFNQPSSTGNQSVSGLSFTPSVAMFFSRGLVSSSTVDSSPSYSIGSAVSSSSRNVSSFTSLENNTRTAAGTDGSAAKCIQLLLAVDNATPTLKADADFVTMDSTGFTVNWTTADATAREIGYWVFGSTSSVATTTTTINNGTIKNATIY